MLGWSVLGLWGVGKMIERALGKCEEVFSMDEFGFNLLHRTEGGEL